MIRLDKKLELLGQLRQWLKDRPHSWQIACIEAEARNPWFTAGNIDNASLAITEQFLHPQKLASWLKTYDFESVSHFNALRLGLICAGNIPMAGFHDFLCGFLSPHHLVIKLSDKDKVLLPAIIDFLHDLCPELEDELEYTTGKLRDFDAVIATGSNNTGRYFEYYFSGCPHIIRGHRNSLAVLTGHESAEEIAALANDVFDYFGLGCRNVTRILVPRDYDFEFLLQNLKYSPDPAEHNKYRNNYDYKLAVLMLNREHYMCNGQIILCESDAPDGGIAVLNYAFYDEASAESIVSSIDHTAIQCIVCRDQQLIPGSVAPGQAQMPELRDYPDGQDTMKFLLNLHKNANHEKF